MAIRIYCEQADLTDPLRRLQEGGQVELVRLAGDARPGPSVQTTSEIRDLNLKRSELPKRYADYQGSPHFETILTILGFTHRREALGLDYAAASGCAIFATRDPDVLRHRDRLDALLGMRFLHPVRDAAELDARIAGGTP